MSPLSPLTRVHSRVTYLAILPKACSPYLEIFLEVPLCSVVSSSLSKGLWLALGCRYTLRFFQFDWKTFWRWVAQCVKGNPFVLWPGQLLSSGPTRVQSLVAASDWLSAVIREKKRNHVYSWPTRSNPVYWMVGGSLHWQRIFWLV